MTKPFYITTPIYYVNDKPHLGHAYTTVAADAKARFHRLRGEPAFLLTGTDENAQKVERVARAAGEDPLAFCDAYSAKFRELWAKLNIRYDDYIRTTEERHKLGVQEIWRRVREAGDIYLGSYAGWYAVRDEAFYAEEEISEGPDGKKVAPTGAEVEWVEEPSYFFRLGKYQEPLLAHYRAHPEFVQPETRRNEVVRFVESGLRDLSVSRTSIKWGIPVPDDPAHVVYVWFDALSNYLTAGGFGPGGAAPGNPWPADQHFIGMDIIRFHAVFWPAFLMSAGVPLPKQVFSHGWWTVEGQKMSKSLGNAVDPHWLIEEYGVDPIRYFLLREIAFGLDGDFSHRALIERINSDLANDLGNLLHRTLSMVKRYRGGRVRRAPGGEGEAEEALRRNARECAGRYVQQMEATNFQEALRAALQVVGAANKYLDSSAPWALAKEKREERLDAVLYHAAASARLAAVLVSPVMPAAAEKMGRQLGLPEGWLSGPFDRLAALESLPDSLETKLGEPVFPRIEEDAREEIQRKVAARIAGGEALPVPAGEKPGPKAGEGEADAGGEAANLVTIDDFRKLDLRAARVMAAEAVPKSKNLLKLQVTLGGAPRTVVAGIARHYAPEALVGRTIILVANLAPARLMGIESQGMLLAARDGDRLLVAGVEGEISPGAKIQ
ncbi:MAG: methionine--tRNA ligase [Candidatus Tectomicrobia bacterium]|uniref:Methionine--tRNA ligase n=1 Tax=Tectimicrobiota bacterium TaxID=2528274 RepID=A0A932HXI2_UNCTE|nr:methionine--tRNA ligase [Candidatus Tectomicrobia bacterium]